MKFPCEVVDTLAFSICRTVKEKFEVCELVFVLVTDTRTPCDDAGELVVVGQYRRRLLDGLVASSGPPLENLNVLCYRCLIRYVAYFGRVGDRAA